MIGAGGLACLSSNVWGFFHPRDFAASRVQIVRRNLLLADWADEDHVESLMNSRNSKWAAEMMSNVRQACCVAGGVAWGGLPSDVAILTKLNPRDQNPPFRKPDSRHCVCG
jgi:hypothetical protein